MKKSLKIAGVVLGGLILVIIIAILYIQFKGIPSYETKKLDFQASSTAEKLERGKKLTSLLCANCHEDPETGKLTGTPMIDAPPEFGEIYAPNITGDKAYGIGNWTDGELLYLFRTGIKRDGQYAPPYMPKLPHMADEDLESIIAFLRSNDQLVEADLTPDQPSRPSLLTKFLCNVAFKPLPMPTQKIEMPDTSNLVELGRYLAYNLDCFSCHSADFKTVNTLEPELSEGYFAGGNKPLNLEGQIMPTSNLTPDAKTGIGNWTENEFIRATRFGLKEGEPALRYPMIPYVQLTDREAGAIYRYLRTIPAIENNVERASF